MNPGAIPVKWKGTADEFGAALAAGDFDCDGYTDLAIGVPNSSLGGRGNAGAVQVIYGSSVGLAAARNQHWSQLGGWVDKEGDDTGLHSGDIYGGPEDNDRFGGALTAGDSNGDGYTDLAIGVYKEDITAVVDAGAVNLLYGSVDGSTWVGNQFWDQSGGH